MSSELTEALNQLKTKTKPRTKAHQIVGIPWERQPGETRKAWAAFELYRDMPRTERSVRQVTLALYDGRMTNRGRVGTWSSLWNWVARSDAWDTHVSELSRQKLEQGALKRADLLESILDKALRIVNEALGHLDASKLSAGEIHRVGSVALAVKDAVAPAHSEASDTLEELLAGLDSSSPSTNEAPSEAFSQVETVQT